ncbi:MAG: vitamin B12-dependent ribonucleotide reductase, partial [Acidimicrobiia bacterium]|nr:vitamin B12-dependent ribonucleotide reductase [Acidimicrobiia bacterium]
KLAGGGYFKIANQSIAPALRHLGYTGDQIDEIVDYVVGTMTLLGAPGVNRASLTSKGFSTDDLRNVEEILPGVFDLNHAFNVFVLGEETMQRLGFSEEQYTSFDFDMLRALGFSSDEIRMANDVVCGRQTIEGAPYLRDEHLAVFDTANRNGKHGERFIHHNGHIKMMAAAQPFISGAISKTINMPNEVSVEDIEGSYMLSAELGLKAMALYRDGSKASQPLSATSDEGEHPDDELEGLPEALEDEARIVTGAAPAIHFAPGVSPTMAYQGMSRPRFLLPARRSGFTQEARVGGHKLFVRTGEYEDGTLGELFIDLAKEGATLRGVLSCFAIAVSKGLQYGVPLDEYVDTFTFQTFEPRGMVEGHPNIKMANSIVDYVFRALGMEYLGRNDLVQVPPTETRALPEPPKGIATQTGQQLGLEEAKMEDDIAVQSRAAAFVDAEVVDITDSSPTEAASTPVATPTIKQPTNGTSAGATNGEPAAQATAVIASDAQTSSVQAALASNMGDAPLCDTCGHITVRNGSCYRCMNCGDSKGCS